METANVDRDRMFSLNQAYSWLEAENGTTAHTTSGLQRYDNNNFNKEIHERQ
jgi:hypothetical protein